MKNRLTELAKQLRKNMTNAEHLLWKHLRGKQLNHLKFRRQHTIGNYIVDFVCIEKKLIIEIDGGQHADNERYDLQRTKYLQKKGYHVIRFWNNEVLQNSTAVLEKILQYFTPT